jgi:hypothetical protein
LTWKKKNKALEKTIREYLEQVKVAAISKPDIKFALAKPTLRPAHQWYVEYHEAFGRKIADGIRMMDLSNV